jgi:threonine/homoserine/homoserine lactone efflux protein
MINFTLLISLISLTFLSIITPGPSNLVVMSSSALFGWRKTLPFFFGISSGSALMVTASVYGLGSIIEQWPWLLSGVKLFGAIWLANMSLQFLKKGFSNNSQQKNTNQPKSTRPFYNCLWICPLHQYTFIEIKRPNGFLIIGSLYLI